MPTVSDEYLEMKMFYFIDCVLYFGTFCHNKLWQYNICR
jgi:hypothetical protein